jgi:hypothetical protein
MAKKATSKKSPFNRVAKVASPVKLKGRSNPKPSARVLQNALRGGHPHEDDEICACDVVLTDSENTQDESLPQAKGGVERSELKGL